MTLTFLEKVMTFSSPGEGSLLPKEGLEEVQNGKIKVVRSKFCEKGKF